MKKVIVRTRAVYHKIASVEINIPSHIDDDDVRDWLFENEDFFIDELDKKLSQASFDYGRGLVDGMDDDSSDSETRYDILSTDGKIYYGGHC
jgi:hypothetical protein